MVDECGLYTYPLIGPDGVGEHRIVVLEEVHVEIVELLGHLGIAGHIIYDTCAAYLVAVTDRQGDTSLVFCVVVQDERYVHVQLIVLEVVAYLGVQAQIYLWREEIEAVDLHLVRQSATGTIAHVLRLKDRRYLGIVVLVGYPVASDQMLA